MSVLSYKSRQPPLRRALLSLLLCLLCAGCLHYSTPAQRDASFVPYKDAKIGQQSIRKYLIDRSAVILMADKLDITSAGSNFINTENTNAWHGEAAAVDRRGYFLTAAHCVLKGQFWLIYTEDGKLQIKRARVVWRGDVKKREPDLAVLCDSTPIGHAFEWAADFTNGTPVVGLGFTMGSHSPVVKPQCMAGKILKISEGLSAVHSDYTIVSHDLPLRHGDSGGPLVLSDGRLLGINVAEAEDLKWSHLSFEPSYGTAHRPNLAWLQKIIDADANSQSVSRL